MTVVMGRDELDHARTRHVRNTAGHLREVLFGHARVEPGKFRDPEIPLQVIHRGDVGSRTSGSDATSSILYPGGSLNVRCSSAALSARVGRDLVCGRRAAPGALLPGCRPSGPRADWPRAARQSAIRRRFHGPPHSAAIHSSIIRFMQILLASSPPAENAWPAGRYLKKLFVERLFFSSGFRAKTALFVAGTADLREMAGPADVAVANGHRFGEKGAWIGRVACARRSGGVLHVNVHHPRGQFPEKWAVAGPVAPGT